MRSSSERGSKRLRALRAHQYLVGLVPLAMVAVACSSSGGAGGPDGSVDAGGGGNSHDGDADADVHGGSGGARGDATAGGSGGSAAGGSGGSAAGGSGGVGAAGGGGGSASAGSGGSAGAGGGGGSGGSADAGAQGPCDIYEAGGTSCVAAHSTVRALYGAYSGNLYQVMRASDRTTKDIAVLAPGGFADTSIQESFCSGTTCTIPIIYDQSPQGNHLGVSSVAHWLPDGGVAANATDAKITVGGHTVYGISVDGNFGNTHVAYRNDSTKGVATADQPESMYMVVDGTHFSAYCCFDYGNAETNGNDDGNATMEAVYWGNSTQFTGGGAGTGPWIAADLENGLFYGGANPANPATSNASLSGTAYVTAMLKGPSASECASGLTSSGCFALKAGNAQSGTLMTEWNGARPSGYSPQKKQGAIILGTGGDGSGAGTGIFFEGCITSGNPSDAIDDAVQANIVAAGYGH